MTTAFRQAALGKADPFAREREIAWEGPGAMSTGRIACAGDTEVVHWCSATRCSCPNRCGR